MSFQSHSDLQERSRARGFVEENGATPCRSDFFAFVRRMEGLLRHMPRVGTGRHLSDEPLVFHQTTYLEFAPSTVHRVRPLPERDAGGPVGRMEGYFLGLLGPYGPMPLALTEYVWARSQGIPHPERIAPMTNAPVSVHRRDTSLEDFFNIFNHRFISFLYRAWASCRKAVDYDRPQESKFSNYVGSFVGLGMESLKQRLAVPDETVLFFSGHFANRSRHAGGLSAVVADYFGTAAEVVENVGQWIEIPEGDRGSLGGMGGVPLGQGLVVGGRIWDRQLKFVLRLGPMSLDAYGRLFPGKPGHASLKSLVQFYTNRELYCSVNLVLSRDEYPGTQLGGGAQLGLSTWLHASPPAEDLDDLLLSLQ